MSISMVVQNFSPIRCFLHNKRPPKVRRKKKTNKKKKVGNPLRDPQQTGCPNKVCTINRGRSDWFLWWLSLKLPLNVSGLFISGLAWGSHYMWNCSFFQTSPFPCKRTISSLMKQKHQEFHVKEESLKTWKKIVAHLRVKYFNCNKYFVLSILPISKWVHINLVISNGKILIPCVFGFETFLVSSTFSSTQQELFKIKVTAHYQYIMYLVYAVRYILTINEWVSEEGL